jgi:hypothetical protein
VTYPWTDGEDEIKDLNSATVKKATKRFLAPRELRCYCRGKDPRVQKEVDAGNYEQLFGTEQ